jgi:hypothetical protein
MNSRKNGSVTTDPGRNMFVDHKAKLRVVEILTLMLCYVPIAMTSAQETIGGGWSISSTGEIQVVQMVIQFQPGKGTNDKRYLRVGLHELEGLSEQDLLSHNTAVKFSLNREAGTFFCEGTFKDGKGSGTLTFSPDRAFAGKMRELGFDNLSMADEFSMAVQNIGLARVQELKARKGGNLSRSQLLHVIYDGADADSTKGLGGSSANWQSTTQQTPMGQTLANSDFSRELEAMGYAPLTPAQISALRENGVTVVFIKQLNAMGYVNPPVEQLAALRENGTTVKYIQEIEALGYPRPSIGNLLALRRNGVSAAYIKELRALGYQGLTLADIAKLRGEGINPDLIRKVVAMGYGPPSISELMSMQIQGVTPDYIKEVQALGYKGLSVKQLVCMRIQGLTVDFMKQTRANGHKVSVRELVKLRSSGKPIEGACGLEVFPDDLPK